MPFKTKRQKIAANARRFELSQSASVNYDIITGAVSSKSEKDSGADAKAQKGVKAIESLSYVGADLVKILLLASLIFVAQIILALTRA